MAKDIPASELAQGVIGDFRLIAQSPMICGLCAPFRLGRRPRASDMAFDVVENTVVPTEVSIDIYQGESPDPPKAKFGMPPRVYADEYPEMRAPFQILTD